MYILKRTAILLIILMLGVVLFGFGNPQTEKEEDLVAKVNGEGITQVQFDEKLEQFKAYAKSQGIDVESEAHNGMLSQIQDQVLEGLIQEILFSQYADKNDIKVDQDKVESQIDQIRQMVGEEQFEEALKAQNLTEETLRAQIEQSLLSETVYEKTVSGVQVSEEEVQNYYEKNKAELVKAEVSHILILAEENVSSEEKEKARKTAQEVIDKLNSGEDFSALAQEYSEDPGSKSQGGKLPQPVRKDDPSYVPGFVAGVWDLKEGEYSSAPVASSFGFHIIKVDAIYDTLPDLKDELENALLQEKKNEKFADFYNGLNEEAEIEIIAKDTETGQEQEENAAKDQEKE